jgi:hypothetical protein
MGLVASLALVTLAAGAPRALVVRVTDAAAPCVEAAARGTDPARPPLVLNVGPLEGEGDLFIGSAAAVTRAIESGAALDDDETDVARIPWVLSVAPGALPGLRDLADLLERDVVVGVLAGAEFVEARRALAAFPEDRVREAEDPRALNTALVTLTPLSLAPPGRRIAVEGVPALLVRGAVGARARNAGAARSVLRYLAGAAGERGAAACGPLKPSP